MSINDKSAAAKWFDARRPLSGVSLVARAYAAQEAYRDAKAAIFARFYLSCRKADRMIRAEQQEAEDTLHRAMTAHREALAAMDAADEEAQKAHYWLERVCAMQRLEYAQREGYAPSQIKAYRQEYDDACAAYDDFMNDDNY